MTVNKTHPPFPILLVDDEDDALQSFTLALKSFGLNNILLCHDSREVLGVLAKQQVELIMLDLTMPHLGGEELLPQIVNEHPDVAVIVITGKNDVATAVQCMQAGAKDYLLKPVEKNRLKASIMNHLDYRRLQRENDAMKQQLLGDNAVDDDTFAGIITQNPAMLALVKYARVIAKSSEPLLITGETGVGKELLAKAIHACSWRSGEFVSINVAGLDDNVFSDTLFGHSKGAFTDAYQRRSGLVEKAAGGTLFLDEIGDLSLPSQIKLLRLLQENEYYPLGSDIAKKADIRVMTATNTPCDALMKSGQFRKDLFYRLYVHHIHIPPLRERMDDIPLLVNQFVAEAARLQEKKVPDFSIGLLALLLNYSYPGNIRELRAIILDAVSSDESGTLSLKNCRERIVKQIEVRKMNVEPGKEGMVMKTPFGSTLPTIQEAETELIRQAMKQAGGNQTIASQLLGIARQTLNKKLKTLTLEDN